MWQNGTKSNPASLKHATKMSKISFRFFNDRPVRAVWDEENSKWWFSVPDVVGVLNAQDDHTKNRNYWKYPKNKLKASAPQLVSATNQLKMKGLTGKARPTAEQRGYGWT